MSPLVTRIYAAWEKHHSARLHSGNINEEPVLVTEYPKSPEFLILCPDNWRTLCRDRDIDEMGMMMSREFMGMKISVLIGHGDIPDTVEVR